MAWGGTKCTNGERGDDEDTTDARQEGERDDDKDTIKANDDEDATKAGEGGEEDKRGRQEGVTVGENGHGGKELDLYSDMGSNITIIKPAMYRRSMGKVVAAKSYLRAWAPRACSRPS